VTAIAAAVELRYATGVSKSNSSATFVETTTSSECSHVYQSTTSCFNKNHHNQNSSGFTATQVRKGVILREFSQQNRVQVLAIIIFRSGNWGQNKIN